MPSTNIAALIVAAGRGSRVGSDVPKQYLTVNNVPILRKTAALFLDHPAINDVLVVIHEDDASLYGQAIDGLELLPSVTGGASRQESVRRGLEALVPRKPDYVLIHDGARPFVTAETITNVIHKLAEFDGAIAAIPVSDTLKRTDGKKITGTVSRDQLWRAQTPQGFRFDAILGAHRRAMGAALTDDAAVAEADGLSVAIVEASEANFKVTTVHDLERANILSATPSQIRIGNGFDVHKFGPGDHVMLCGIRIPHTSGLVGHSDADVAIHALVDALLGSVGLGDIGEHFPPSESKWAGADSALFLKHAKTLVRNKAGQISNVDLTIICERPKLGPFKTSMRNNIAALLSVDPGQVNVKATTTEKLGFTGRQEGIAVQAVASVILS